MSKILYEVEKGKAKPFAFSTMQHKVQRMREARIAVALYFRRLPSRRHNRIGGSGADRRTGAARCQRTGRSKVTSVTPSAPRNACSRPPASGTRTGWRTKWRQTFRMKALNKV
jgi:hypothetical protein